jgi:hypothetical protein
MHLEPAGAARHLAAVRTGEGPPHILVYVPNGRQSKRRHVPFMRKFLCRSRYKLFAVQYANVILRDLKKKLHLKISIYTFCTFYFLTSWKNLQSKDLLEEPSSDIGNIYIFHNLR